MAQLLEQNHPIFRMQTSINLVTYPPDSFTVFGGIFLYYPVVKNGNFNDQKQYLSDSKHWEVIGLCDNDKSIAAEPVTWTYQDGRLINHIRLVSPSVVSYEAGNMNKYIYSNA